MSIPDDVVITTEAREPVWDPTLGIPVGTAWQGKPTNRLVTIGDSLTQGFASGAIYQTDLSYSAIIAYELGWDGLRYPIYGGPGGLPLNIERVLPRVTDADRRSTLFDAAAALGAQTGDDPEHGIETLVVFLGANNALGAVNELRVVWSGPGYDDLARNGAFTVWRPTHFIAELAHVVTKVQAIRARHVIWCTVPHVTIAPIARGVDGKIAPDSRYFPYYTRPWISDSKFEVGRDPSITGDEARAVDSAIDQYNDAITLVVADGRRQ